MKRHSLVAAIFIGLCAAGTTSAAAVGLHLQLFPLTGEIQLRNKNAMPATFDYFSMRSTNGTLNPSPSVWRSISDVYDLSGNGFIDPSHNWTKLEETSLELAEGAVTGPGGTLLANRAISLGTIWNSAPPLDLIVEAQTNGVAVPLTLEYALAGDYLRDGIVNQLDYNLWRQNFGSTTSLDADGNLNGIVDSADYVLWRKNQGASIPSLTIGPGAGSGGQLQLGFGSVVPEPASIVLFTLTAASLVAGIRRRAVVH